MRKTFLRRVCASFMALSFVLTQSGGVVPGLGYDLARAADASVLADKITAAEELLADAVEGTGIGEYEVGSKSIFQNAIDNANNALSISEADPGVVDPAIAALDSATTAFQGSLITELADADKDSIPDVDDNCINIANMDQADKDGDGEGDMCDPFDDTDTDKDGVADLDDNCPLLANTSQLDKDSDGEGDVCDAFDDTDTDEDLIADVEDNCSLIVNSNQADQDDDGFGDVCDADDDDDSVPDTIDNCLLFANEDQADENDNGIGDACENIDSDGDEIMNETDNCPLIANSNQENADGDEFGDVCDTDDDNDEVADTTDNCLLISNTDQADIDSDGTGDACDETDDRKKDDDNSSNGGGGLIILAKFNPLNASVVINSGNEKTAIGNVALALSAENAEMMAIANDSGFAGSSWEIYNPSKQWTLTEGNGVKTVYAKFKNASGTESKVYTDEITLDGSASDDNGSVLGDNTVGIYNGDLIRCKTSDDPGAVYVVKIVGNKKFIRHIKSDFFKFYEDIIWSDVKEVASLDEYTISKWVRINTGINGTAKPTDKVYEINGDWTKHWLNMTTDQFFARGGSEEAIFSVNQGELDSYAAGADVL